MKLILQIHTMNCGNDSPGQIAANQILDTFKRSNADVFILNCQEANFAKTLQVFKNHEVAVTVAQKIVTHTKLKTQLSNQTGMLTLLLHKHDIDIQVDKKHSKSVRRQKSRIGCGFNKGGMLTRFIASKGKSRFTIDTINAHLDAFNEENRAIDWANLHHLRRHSVKSWNELSSVIPNLICSGYDANTRNKLSESNNKQVTQSAWNVNPLPDMHQFIMAPFGNYRMSQPSTYRSEVEGILSCPDKRRPNCAKGGMVDVVDVADPQRALDSLSTSAPTQLVDLSTTYISPEPSSRRDHAVIGSPDIVIQDKKSDFNKVREWIGCTMANASPQLAFEVLHPSFIDTLENRNYLLTLYQQYLSPVGLLQRKLELHAENLRILTILKKKGISAEYQEMMFPSTLGPWFPVNTISNDKDKLTPIVKYHKCLIELEKLRNSFFYNNASQKEIEIILQIVNNATTFLKSGSEQSFIRQTKKLLEFNRMVQKYKIHLKADEDLPTEKTVLISKITSLKTFEEILTHKKPPQQLLKELDNELNNQSQSLRPHRNNQWYTKLYRKLKMVLLKKNSQSHGTFFFDKAKKLINENQDSPTINVKFR